MSHPDLSGEQAYVDRAYAFLERMREIVARAGDKADGEVAQAALDAWAARRLQTYEDAERGLVFGRLDFEAVDQQRVTLRRRFRTHGRRLLDIADEAFDGSTLDGAAVGDFLLEELERSRETRMREIVATIQADQYRLITREADRPLVIQGGPGTGKTAVGLHRASWLLYSYRERLARAGVLVVGPNRTFMEYVSHVLPALGENSVEQREVAELVAKVREELGTTAAARERFRMELLRRFYEEYGRVLGGAAFRNFEEVERALRAKGYLDRVLKAAWPIVSPEKLVRSLLSSKQTLAEAADGILAPDEQRLLLRRGTA